MKVKRRTLLFIASLVWIIAGFNIVKIGLHAYLDYFFILNVFLSCIVFIIFWFLIFSKLVNKHTKRIHEYVVEKQNFWNFFDVKSFVIMAVMMSGGIIIRAYSLVPEVAIAVFYTGLGSALLLAGIKFGINYLKF